MSGLEITHVRVRQFEHQDNRLKGFATVTFNDCFLISDLKIISGPKGVFVAMPSRKNRDGTYRDIAHPLNQECRDMIEKKVLEVFEHDAEHGGNGSNGDMESMGDADDEDHGGHVREGPHGYHAQSA